MNTAKRQIVPMIGTVVWYVVLIPSALIRVIMDLNYSDYRRDFSQAPIEEFLRIFSPFAACLMFAIVSFWLFFHGKVNASLIATALSFSSVIFFYTVLI